jgi:hypothetical protein
MVLGLWGLRRAARLGGAEERGQARRALRGPRQGGGGHGRVAHLLEGGPFKPALRLRCGERGAGALQRLEARERCAVVHTCNRTLSMSFILCYR